MRNPASESGVTLIETLIAVLIAVVGLFSVGGLIFQGTVTNKNQGTEVTRATIYAQDKMEKLLSLNFSGCTQSASAQPASCNTTNISASGWTEGLLAGGAIGPSVQATCPNSGASVGYIDFLDSNGIQLPGSTAASGCTYCDYSFRNFIRTHVADYQCGVHGRADTQTDLRGGLLPICPEHQFRQAGRCSYQFAVKS